MDRIREVDARKILVEGREAQSIGNAGAGWQAQSLDDDALRFSTRDLDL
jgi:hypothetical protein